VNFALLGWRRQFLDCLDSGELRGEGALNGRRAKQQREKCRFRQSRRASKIARDII